MARESTRTTWKSRDISFERRLRNVRDGAGIFKMSVIDNARFILFIYRLKENVVVFFNYNVMLNKFLQHNNINLFIFLSIALIVAYFYMIGI